MQSVIILNVVAPTEQTVSKRFYNIGPKIVPEEMLMNCRKCDHHLFFYWCYDIQYKDTSYIETPYKYSAYTKTKHNDSQHDDPKQNGICLNNTQHNDIQHINTEHSNTENVCHQ
jgi:hypothetical protein